MSDEIIVENLHYSYPPLTRGGEPVSVLRGVDLRIARGEFVALLGRVGAGKTTLCMALNGLVPHVTGGVLRGSVTVAGLDTRRHPVSVLARTVGLVFQDPESQLVQMRVEDEVAFGLENLSVPAPQMEERVAWALEAVGLGAHRFRSPLSLSGGEKQRVAIAAMLAMRPRVLILDEPTASLDPAGKAAIFNVLAFLRAHHEITIVMATQELERIGHYADRIVVMHDGRVDLNGRPADVFGQVSRLADLGVGVPQMSELAHLLSARTGRQYEFYAMPDAYKELHHRAHRVQFHKVAAAHVQQPVPLANPFADRAQVCVEGVSFSYDDGTLALRGVDLVLRPGEWVALLGPNGAGKSTLARHFNGLLRPVAGRIMVEDQDTRQVSVARLARSVGYAFQNPDHQIFAPTVREEVAFGLRNQELPDSTIERRVTEALARFGLTCAAETPPALLGFAERRKVALASVLAMQPKLLILDEPTGGLDWRTQVDLMGIMATYNAQGRAIVLITHDMRLVAEYTRRAIVLVDGRVLYDGATRDLFARPEVLAQAGLALPPVALLASRLRSNGIPADVLTNEEFVAYWLARLAAQRARKQARDAARQRVSRKKAKR